MNEQRALSRIGDPETSHQAAQEVDASRLETLVLLELDKKGNYGATTFELSQNLAVERVSISPRMRPLANRGEVRDSGHRRRALLNTGREGPPGIVWVRGNGQLPLAEEQVKVSRAITLALVKACRRTLRVLKRKEALSLEEIQLRDDYILPALKRAGVEEEDLT